MVEKVGHFSGSSLVPFMAGADGVAALLHSGLANRLVRGVHCVRRETGFSGRRGRHSRTVVLRLWPFPSHSDWPPRCFISSLADYQRLTLREPAPGCNGPLILSRQFALSTEDRGTCQTALVFCMYEVQYTGLYEYT